MIAWLKYAAKAVVAVCTVILTGVVAGELELDPAIVYALQAIVAGLGVFYTKNGEAPT